MRIQFVARFRSNREYSAVEVDDVEKYELEKIESFNPYWVIRDMMGKKIGSVESLLVFKEALEIGSVKHFNR